MRLLCVFLTSLFILSCSVKVPDDIHPITGFQLSRYLGTWYEVARIDNHFEKGLSQVSANYTLQEDGGVKVLNKGWNDKEKKWEQSVGKAYFIKSPQDGSFKVSFFGPFYGGYNIIKIDKNYQIALVVGSSKNYLWLLSRTPTISSEKLEEFLVFAEKSGFNRKEIIVFQ